MVAEKDASSNLSDIVKTPGDGADPFYDVYVQNAREELYEDDR